MEVNRISNQQPTFGMKYVKPRTWEPSILETLMDSKLVKEIDVKYPKAEAMYENTYHLDRRLETLDYFGLRIKLAKDKVVTLFDCFGSDEDFIGRFYNCEQKINNTTLDDLENIYQEDQRIKSYFEEQKEKNNRIFSRVEAENAKARTPFQNFICKIFGIE